MNDGQLSRVILAGDIGGTKTNLGLFRPGKERPIQEVVETYSSRSAPDLSDLVTRFLDRHPASVSGACFAMAGPVFDGVCKATNLPWRVSEPELQKRFGWKVRLLNDLVATGFFVPLLQDTEVHALNDPGPKEGRTKALVAPGTGLGHALLVFQNGRYVALASEGGHVDFAPADEEQVLLWRYMQQRYGHVSVERIASGMGFVNLFSWLKERKGQRVPDWLEAEMERSDPARAITRAAMDGRDPFCLKILGLFCSILGAVAGNLALSALATGGVYLGGGIPPKILPALSDGRFMKAFTDKGRFRGLMKEIAVRVILNERAAIQGAAVAALESER